MAEVKITSSNFEEEVVNSKIPVMVDFWASWCGPCMMMGPVVSELAEELEGKVKVGKINVDEEQSLAMKYGINAIPAILLFKDGKVAGTAVGYRPKEDLLQLLK